MKLGPSQIDWNHLTRVVRLEAYRQRRGAKPVFPQLEWEHYRAEYEARVARKAKEASDGKR